MIYLFNNGQQELNLYLSSLLEMLSLILILQLKLLLLLFKNYIRAVIAAAKPKKIPGALANATGISLCSLNKP